MLAREHGPVECLSGTYQTESRSVDFALPEWFARPLRRRRHRFAGAQAYVAIERFFGARLDYLTLPPDASRRRILDNLDDERLRALYDAVRRHDTIVIDGDGDMIFKEEPRRNLLADLALIELGHHLGKDIYYVNALFSDCPVTGRNEALADHCVRALEKCETVAFRDPASLELAEGMSDTLDATWFPDSLFSWFDALQDSHEHVPSDGDFVVPYPQEQAEHFGELDFGMPYVCITGGSRAAFDQERAFKGYCGLVEQLRRLDLPVYLVPTCYGDRFLRDVAAETGAPFVPTEVPIMMGGAILANARLLVTGRYHPSIMAASGGTPCVFLGADSHKTSSLQRLLGYDEPVTFSAVPDSGETDDILARSRELMNRGQPLRDVLQDAAGTRAAETERLAMLVNGS